VQRDSNAAGALFGIVKKGLRVGVGFEEPPG